jgi:hypothetical protein
MKIKNIILLLLLLINYSIGKAQCSFSYSKDICGERDASYSAIELWGGDFIVGSSGGCGANPDLTVLTRLNCKGETVWYKSYPENNAFGGVVSILQLDSETVLVSSYGVAARIFKVNINTGELIADMHKFVPNNTFFDFIGGSDIIIHDQYIYCTLRNVLSDSNHKYFVVKITLSKLELCWIKTINLNNLDPLHIVVPFSTFTLKNQIGVIGYIGNDERIFIQSIDTAGNLIDTQFPFDNLSGNKEKPKLISWTSQSKYTGNICVSFFVKSSSTINYIGVIDTSGLLLKYLQYDDVKNITETKDGGYAVCGRNDLIRKLDSNFQTVYDIKSKWPGSWYFTIGEAHDGGLFATGMANIFATDGDMAFIKAEPHGGINSVQEVQDITAQIQTTPNPATTQVHIESPIKIESYTLNNTSGTQVQSGMLENDNNIDISQLPQGIYFLQLQLVNGQRVVKKLVRSY